MNRLSKFLMIFGLITASICYAKEPSVLIQETLHEANETLFSPRSLRVELLKNCPEAIPVLAEWIYEDWHSYDSSLTREKLIQGMNHRLNDDRLPLTFVALRDSAPVGIISLKNRVPPEFSDLDDGSPWGGSFHITAEERNQGLGETLATVLVTIAKRLGYEKIYFYTSNPKNVGWYTARGAEIIDERPFHGHVVTVMKFVL